MPVEPADLATLAEIARKIGVHRSAVRVRVMRLSRLGLLQIFRRNRNVLVSIAAYMSCAPEPPLERAQNEQEHVPPEIENPEEWCTVEEYARNSGITSATVEYHLKRNKASIQIDRSTRPLRFHWPSLDEIRESSRLKNSSSPPPEGLVTVAQYAAMRGITTAYAKHLLTSIHAQEVPVTYGPRRVRYFSAEDLDCARANYSKECSDARLSGSYYERNKESVLEKAKSRYHANKGKKD